jgi:hypothetical protein
VPLPVKPVYLHAVDDPSFFVYCISFTKWLLVQSPNPVPESRDGAVTSQGRVGRFSADEL